MTLSQHSTSLLEVITALFGSVMHRSMFAGSWLHFFGLDGAIFPRFLLNLQLAAVFHDIGKANDGFQACVVGKGRQVIRHEHLSALLLWLKEPRAWLASRPDADFEILLGAILTHHLKVDDSSNFIQKLEPVSGFTVYTKAADFRETLDLAAPLLGSQPPDLSRYDGEWLFDSLHKDSLHEHLYRSKRKLKDSAYLRLFLAIKAALVAVDSAASAFLREGVPLREWLSNAFEMSPLSGADVNDKVIKPRIEQVERRSGSIFVWHDFQAAAGTLGPRALILAGCGSGKTLAAWRWVEHQASQRAVSRVVFLYPTRATATEGFRDYVSWAGGEDAALLHGTSAYDLEGMFTSPSDSRSAEDYAAREGLYALGYWPKRIFSATVDSFLAFMSNSYGSICMMPVLADSVVVIDEVHSFDRSMFTALERFLTFFPQLPVLCMTASLTSDRLDTLRNACGLSVFPEDPARFEDLRMQTEAPRYCVSTVSANEVPALVKGALLKGEKVLWVVNTVDRCQEAAAVMHGFCKEHDIPLACYHSRFRLHDRKEMHRQVVDLCQSRSGAMLAVTTQVCEMSLDLDADVLVTETAPVPSLIQRMGRCCRVPLPGSRRGRVLAYPPPDERPYTKAESSQGYDFMTVFSYRPEVSQSMLLDYLASMDVAKPHVEGGFTGFLDAGWYAMSADESFREGIDYTVECILDADIGEYLSLRKSGRPVDGLAVPVPRQCVEHDPALGRRFLKAPHSHYSSLTGFHRREVPHV